ncbi:hypothetical protein AVEN_233086-1 [Araneus ventricosus]|uniref:Uncharacterized protein n=1 Tax=Araneus ventricosus TaxID=182803 RepID=A0A4Y2IFH2_ARAVE|nr:hypothetical protein AVEN_233086-1 [Araneus ventricosus]
MGEYRVCGQCEPVFAPKQEEKNVPAHTDSFFVCLFPPLSQRFRRIEEEKVSFSPPEKLHPSLKTSHTSTFYFSISLKSQTSARDGRGKKREDRPKRGGDAVHVNKHWHPSAPASPKSDDSLTARR